MMTLLGRYSIFLLFLLNSPAIAQNIFSDPISKSGQNITSLTSPIISYLIPDIGAPGMNIYTEIIGPYDRNGNFGTDGFYLNNPGDTIRLICANPSDTNKIVIGPIVVSWNGKMISTQIFVLSGEQPNSDNWQQLSAAFRIPLQVILNSNISNTDTFYVVQSQPAIIASAPGSIGSGSAWGFRSRRGAMIVDSMILNGAGTYTFDTSDCDPVDLGNQGYLPFNLLSRGRIKINVSSTLSISSSGINGGPGGGGGGLGDGPPDEIGGLGYTGGGAGEQHSRPATGGDGTGGVGNELAGGMGLDSLPGSPSNVLCCQSPGGSGNPFVMGGGGVVPAIIMNWHDGDGPGGGFGSVGQTAIGMSLGTDAFLGGIVNGNPMLVPLMGGSGGGGGNEFCSYAPSGPGATGAGGGGALLCYGVSISIDSVTSNGAVGTTSGFGCVNHGSYGGAGSGGGINIANKLVSNIGNIIAAGGISPHANNGGGSGGAGRVRTDGPILSAPSIAPSLASQYIGPSTDTSSYVLRTFTLTGTGNGEPINIYLKPESETWKLEDSISNYQNNSWSRTITLPGNDSLYFLVAAQEIPSPDTAQYTMEPSSVLSQAAANILHITRPQSVTSLSQSYIIPDIGTPGMNTYMEIIGPYNQNGNFGTDGFYLNNSGDNVRVVCANPADTNKIVIGPVAVSWNGKMISTQMFVLPDLLPNSNDWQQLQGTYKIPLNVIIGGSVTAIPDTFYIVKPQSAIISSSPGSIGSGGSRGFRSRRGAMIVDSMVLNGVGAYTFDTSDCDPITPGNQGYLPVTFLSIGAIRVGSNAKLAIDGNGMNGGPGGGGGGGIYDDGTGLASPTSGGSGFSGGEGGANYDGGGGSGGEGVFDSSKGGISLNGMPGGAEIPSWATYYPLPGSQGTGGGSGFPFGTSGAGGWSNRCVQNNTVGGYSGGSGSSECCCSYVYKTAFGGAGAGNATAGTSTTSGGGKISGNSMLVPVSGGSGGAGGNPWYGVTGMGGGGGGALALYSIISNSASMSSMGMDGGNSTLEETSENSYTGAGGGGSGGGIVMMSKLSFASDSIVVSGGTGGVATPNNTNAGDYQNGGSGGSGRVRVDGPVITSPHVSPNDASYYTGPSTDTSSYVSRTFMLTGTGNGELINIYLKPESGTWQLENSIQNYSNNTWSKTITLPGNDSLYFLIAAQEVPSPDTSQYTMEPSWVLSQSAANILHVGGVSEIVVQNEGFHTLICDSSDTSEITITDVGASSLQIDSIRLTQNNEGFSIITILSYPVVLEPGQNTIIHVRLAPSFFGQKSAILTVYSNTLDNSSLIIPLSGDKEIIHANTEGGTFGVINAEQFPVIDTVPVINTGTTAITLTGASFTSAVPFAVITSFPLVIPPSDTGIVLVQFNNPGKDSSYSGTLLFADTPSCAPLTAVVTGIRQTKPPVIASLQLQTLDSLLCETQEFDTIFVHNVGTGTLHISQAIFTNAYLGYSQITPAIPTDITPGDSIMFVIAFTPQSQGQLTDTLQLINNDTIIGHNPWNIVMTARKDSVGFYVNVPAVDNLGTLCVGDTVAIDSLIMNTGSTNIAVTASSQSSVILTHASWMLDTTQRAQKTGMTFIAPAAGDYTDTVTFMDTICHRTQQAVVLAHIAAPVIDANSLNANFGCAGMDTTILLTNPTTDTETITGITISDARVTFPGLQLPLALPPRGTYLLSVNILSDTSMNASGIAAMATITGQPCNLTTTFSITGTYTHISAALSIIADSGSPGDTVYVPVIAYSPDQTLLAGLSYTVRVSYDASILLPIRVIGGTIDTVGSGYAVFTVNNLADTTYLVCIVGLGDATGTAIHIDTVAWSGCTTQSGITDGVFTLTGLCEQGGTRLYLADSGIVLSQNEPNPFNGTTAIYFRTVETGQTRLWVADMLGRRQAMLMDGYIKPGAYNVNFNGNGLSEGIYFYILQTPSQLLRKTMVIVK